ncbi:MAG: SUMF1/EgtB/PvdO family nonheme iron enzyme [Chloroflexi bacterium]|nr:SUMF1/EgtB/PvdO family nonheme iron enzyme [Chloroflexota bacterium]
MPLLPGEILHKRYRIASLLAESPYGATYRARDIVAGQDVAIKEYRDASPQIQKLFRQEARRLSQLHHAQLPTVLDHFSLEETGQYLVSSYVDGVDLQSLVEQYGALPSDLIVGWLQAACKPLQYLHDNDQLHLNIKPANIRIAPTGELFLVDTGLPGLGVRPHVDGYGSPEQQEQTAVSPASDIYSMGATLYTLLTTQIPPNALSRESGLSDLKPAREVNPDVEPYLSLVASRAMSIRSDARYESAADFAQALNRPVGFPDTAVTNLRRTPKTQFGQPAPPPKWTPQRRRKMETHTIIALAIILFLVIGVGAVLTMSNLNEPEVTEVEATATLESAVIAALTAIAPTPSPIPAPTEPPTPTPEPILTESGARMLYVPGGLFRMGDEEGERDERPSHIVNLDPYYIDETEVTNGQYAQCVAAGVCAPPSRNNPTTHPAYYGDPAYDDYPMVFINWRQADTFCEWRGARLPSEAEWEMAAGFDPEQVLIFRYPWGDAFDGTKLNFCDKNCPGGDTAWDDGHKDTAPVGSYPDGRSPIGAYDMSGNVMEWVSDWYDSRYYENATEINPMGPPEGDIKSLRGGSWLSPADEVHVSARGSFDPAVVQANLGFRCAMTAP